MSNPEKIILKPFNRKSFKVTIESLKGSSYIQHALPVEQAEEIVAREFGKIICNPKKIRNEDEEYERCFYREGDKIIIPLRCFYASLLDASVSTDIPKSVLKRAVRLIGENTELKYKKLKKRRDVVRRAGMTKSPDVRVRPEFIDWSVELFIEYDSDLITSEQIINLLNRAGFSTGVGDWRPQKNGNHGMFRIKSK